MTRADDDYWSDDCPRQSSINVPDAPEPEWTGLFDVKGTKLFRRPQPLGFGHHDWNPYS